MRSLAFILWLVLLVSSAQGLAEPRSQFPQNSLDEYVHKKDEVYESRLVRSEKAEGHTRFEAGRAILICGSAAKAQYCSGAFARHADTDFR